VTIKTTDVIGHFTTVFDGLFDGVYFVDNARTIRYWNAGAEHITGFSADEVIGSRCSDNILIHVNSEGVCLCSGECPLKLSICDGLPRRTTAYLHHKDGHRIPTAISVMPVRDEVGLIIGAFEVFTDASEHVALLDMVTELKQLTLLDPLTRLANRRFMEDELSGRLSEMARYGHTIACFMVDIDDFKHVNDTYGHDIGDSVICMVGNTIRSNIRSFDMIARWGGEEFVITLLNMNGETLVKCAENLRMLVARSHVTSKDGDIRVTISMGATLAYADDTVDTLVKRADQLVYWSKVAGKNCVTTPDYQTPDESEGVAHNLPPSDEGDIRVA